MISFAFSESQAACENIRQDREHSPSSLKICKWNRSSSSKIELGYACTDKADIRISNYLSQYQMETKECAECGEKILGRSDKRFCSDSCRNAFNYQKNRPGTNYVRNVTNILKRNRRILEKLNPSGKTKIHRDKLAEKGYNFTYFTNTHRTRKGGEYRFCFEQGLLELDDGWMLLVRRDEYLSESSA